MSLNKALIIFDLDGTLSVSHKCILESCKRTLEALEQPAVTEEFIMSLIGEQYSTFFAKLMPGFADAERAERVYTDIEYEVIKSSAELYPRVPETLERLREMGCRLVLCSNGSVEYEELVTNATGIRGFFDLLISGSDYASKAAAVLEAMRQFPSKLCVMVGDRKHDIDAAVENGIIGIAATYGYTRPGELDAADYSINEPFEVVGIVGSYLGVRN